MENDVLPMCHWQDLEDYYNMIYQDLRDYIEHDDGRDKIENEHQSN
jgi:hypothetical protein